MKHEKIIKDERGSIRIEVTLWTDTCRHKNKHREDYEYQIRVWHKPPKKRIEIANHSIATDQEILEAKLEFWNLFKPQ